MSCTIQDCEHPYGAVIDMDRMEYHDDGGFADGVCGFCGKLVQVTFEAVNVREY